MKTQKTLKKTLKDDNECESDSITDSKKSIELKATLVANEISFCLI